MKTAKKQIIRSYRRHDWYDQKKDRVKYGIQVKVAGYECRYAYCAEAGKPLLFDTEEERDKKLKELRKEAGNNPTHEQTNSEGAE